MVKYPHQQYLTSLMLKTGTIYCKKQSNNETDMHINTKIYNENYTTLLHQIPTITNTDLVQRTLMLYEKRKHDTKKTLKNGNDKVKYQIPKL